MYDEDPTLRGEHLGEELRKLRVAAKLSLAEAGERIGVSGSKMSRLESGKRRALFEDVAGLLAVYGVTGDQRTAMLNVAREVSQRGWLLRTSHAEQLGSLRSLETKATQIVNFENSMVPGLLQTVPYTLAVMTEVARLSPEVAQERMETRLQRQSVLRYPATTRLTALIAQDALANRVGGPEVLRAQLVYLTEAVQRPHITIRVVPKLDHGHPGLHGSFVRYHLPNRPGVVCVENRLFSMFLEDREEVADYDEVTDELLTIALDERESLRLIRGLADELERDTRA